MAEQSCHFMLWQQAVAAGKNAVGGNIGAAEESVATQHLERDFQRGLAVAEQGDPETLLAVPTCGLRDYRGPK